MVSCGVNHQRRVAPVVSQNFATFHSLLQSHHRLHFQVIHDIEFASFGSPKSLSASTKLNRFRCVWTTRWNKLVQLY